MVEVVITMAIIAILSVGVYESYISIIKTTKASEKKQVALHAGNKIIEQIKEISDSGSINPSDTTIELDDNFNLQGNTERYSGTEKLDVYGNYYNRSDYKYIAEVILTKNQLSLNTASKIGYLYDVTVTIKDEEDKELFSEKYNQTININ
ncbi:type II secretory pathway pseudopilin PulG [Clostridium beijerinckii]|nr:type II secretory pathway pseudopilin PulG [Clostridium beijerinckii]NYB95504.1 type II secretory pathway pseudopilin PulG [Clostridium beijerinckii]